MILFFNSSSGASDHFIEQIILSLPYWKWQLYNIFNIYTFGFIVNLYFLPYECFFTFRYQNHTSYCCFKGFMILPCAVSDCYSSSIFPWLFYCLFFSVKLGLIFHSSNRKILLNLSANYGIIDIFITWNFSVYSHFLYPIVNIFLHGLTNFVVDF